MIPQPNHRPPGAPLLAAALCLSAGATPAAEPTPVTLAEVERASWRAEVELTANSIALRRAELSPRVAGLVNELYVDEGDAVAAGDPILQLDDRLARLESDRTAARVAEAEARWRDAVRVRDELQRLEQGRHASRTEIEAAIAEVEIAEAALTAARAEHEHALELLARHRLEAPFDGMIVHKAVERGEWVQQDAAAVELLEIDRVRVRASLPQRDYARVNRGAAVRLRFDALPEEEFTGEVGARIAAGDPRSRSFPLLIDLPNPRGLLAPGMSARVVVELDDEAAQVLTVPRDAVVSRAGGRREVWRVLERDGATRVESVRVDTGRARNDRVELLGDGLAAGDRVVLLGNEQLEPGQAVTPTEGSLDEQALAEQ